MATIEIVTLVDPVNQFLCKKTVAVLRNIDMQK